MESNKEKVARAEAEMMRLLKKYPDLTAGDISYNPETGEVRLRDDKGA